MIYRGTIKTYNNDGTIDVLKSNVDLIECKILGDFKPALESEVVLGQVGNNPNDLIVICYFDEVSKKALEIGEKRIYSTNEGALAASLFLSKDGVLVLNEGEDFAVKYNELKAGFDQLKNDYNSFLNSFNLHTHGVISLGNPTSTPIKPTLEPIVAPPTTADISNSKQESVKL